MARFSYDRDPLEDVQLPYAPQAIGPNVDPYAKNQARGFPAGPRPAPRAVQTQPFPAGMMPDSYSGYIKPGLRRPVPPRPRPRIEVDHFPTPILP